MTIKIPETTTKRLDDADLFIEGFKQLCEMTHLKKYSGIRIGLQRLYFEDGSEFGIWYLFKKLGFKTPE